MKKLAIFLGLFCLFYIPGIIFSKLETYLFLIGTIVILITYMIITFKQNKKIEYHMGYIWTFIPLIHSGIVYLIDNSKYHDLSFSSFGYFSIGLGILLISFIYNLVMKDYSN